MNRSAYHHLLIFTVVLALALTPLSAKAKQERLRLIHADQLESYTEKGKPVKKLTGHVHFTKGELSLKCALAYWFEEEERIDFYKDVVVVKQSRTVTADTLVYYSGLDLIKARGRVHMTDKDLDLVSRESSFDTKQEIFESTGNVTLLDPERELRAHYLQYFTQEKKAVALNGAQIDDLKQHSTLYADSILYFQENGDIYATKNPVLVRRDSTGTESFEIRAKTIEAYENRGDFYARKEVRVEREDFSAFADFLHYNDSLQSASLTGTPKIISDGQEISGNEILLFIRDDVLHSASIRERALAVSNSTVYLPSGAADSTRKAVRDSLRVRDEITGKRMDIFFKESKTDSICVSGMASSIYHVTEDSVIQGVNSTSGDTVQMKFDTNKLTKIIVIGGTRGQFVPHESNREMDTTIVYSGERIDYFMNPRITHLSKDAMIHYGDMEVTAGKITVEWDKNLLYADPLTTAPFDSTPGNFPTFKQTGREPFSGDKMVYNLRTRKGHIIDGETKVEDGFYYGDRIDKTEKKEFYVANGVYTTCDIPKHPHYFFQSRQMKLIPKDKIIARPIVFYIHDIPLLWLPFIVIPDQSGKRHSGWIMPTYGENNTSGGFIKGLGYFWAPNDYMDYRFTGDFFDKKGLIFHYRTRYALRYKFSGSVSGSFSNEFLATYPKKRWDLQINHSQTINPSTRLSANGSFVSSDSYYKELGIQRDTRLNQQLISNATFSKSWPGKPYSLSVNLNETHNLQAQTQILTAPTTAGSRLNYINRTLPNVSFNRSSKPIIPLKTGRSASQSKWFNNIYLGLNSYFKNRQDIYYTSDYNEADSLLWERQDFTRNAFTHSVNMTSSQKILKYVSLNQSLSVQEDWLMQYDKPLLDDAGHVMISNNKIVTQRVNGFLARHTGSFSLTAQTKLYGLFPVRIAGLQSLRHVMTPQIGFSYRPDFTRSIFGWDPGYVQSYTDSTDAEWIYDAYQNSLAGATSSGEQRALTISVQNIFQAKVNKDDKETKLDLFTLNSSTRLNFAADSLQWAPITTSIRTQVTKKIALSISTTHDLYAYRNGRVNEWHKTVMGIPVPRMTNMSASTGFALSGKKFGSPKQSSAPPDTSSDVLDELLPGANPQADSIVENPLSPERGSDFWKANFSFRYSLSSSNPAIRKEAFTMNMNLNLKLTEKWDIGYRANFDLMDKRLITQDVTVYRDLHCWQMSFSWTPSGYGQQYSLMINLKSPSLKDLKYEERGGRARYGF